MRYTIVIAALMFFLLWDGLYNHGQYLDHFIRLLRQGLATVGL